MYAVTTNTMPISRQPSLYSLCCMKNKYLGYVIINYSRYTLEIKSTTAMAYAAFNNNRTLFTSELDLNLRKKQLQCYMCSIAVCGAGT